MGDLGDAADMYILLKGEKKELELKALCKLKICIGKSQSKCEANEKNYIILSKKKKNLAEGTLMMRL